MSNNLQAILYTRVSTSQQEREGTSLESQLAACQAYAKKNRYKVVRKITDTHSGADLWDRPGINEAREMIKKREAGVLVVYAIDRLSRNPAHLLILLEDARRFGARIEFVTEKMEDSAEWKLIQYVRSYAAELEREKIRERSLRGKRQKLMQGKLPVIGIELYGYRRHGERREVYEPEARIIRRIFELTISGWGGRMKIANLLNAEGVPSPSVGKRIFKDGRAYVWVPSAIRRIIEEPAYYGDARGWRWKQLPNGQMVERPESEHFHISPEISPAIVTRETWLLASERSKKNRGEHTFNLQNFRLLRGLVRCSRCNRRVVPDVWGYRCMSRNQVNAQFCGAGGISRLKLDKWVWESVEAILRNPVEMVARIAAAEDAHAPQREEIDQQIDDARKRAQAFQRGQERIMHTIAANDDEDVIDLAHKQLKQLADQRKQTLELIEELERETSHSLDKSDRLKDLATYLEKLEIPTTREGQRELLQALGTEVVAERGNWSLSLSLLAGTAVTSSAEYDCGDRLFVGRRVA